LTSTTSIIGDVVVEGECLTTAREIAVKLAALPQPQAGFVKEYFLKTSTSRREESDFIANALFLRSSVTDIAREYFDKFIRE